jgi:hypothetical protein
LFVSAGKEGAICLWSSTSMNQIERMCSMDVSPGGGMIAWRMWEWNIEGFSIENKGEGFRMENW